MSPIPVRFHPPIVEPAPTPPTPRWNRRRWLLALGSLALAVALVSSGTIMVLTWAFGIGGHTDDDLPDSAPRFANSGGPRRTGILGAVLDAVWPLPQDRFTVLLLGSDRRPNTATSGRADTIMLASLDPVGKTAALISIPRDLWVSMDLGNGVTKLDRINSATLYGENGSYPGGGVGLLKDTLSATLGVTIDRWVRVDLAQFPKIVDTLGGVEVNPSAPVEDGYQEHEGGPIIPLYFPVGPQRLNGEMALWYARTRRQGADFGRMGRQQEVLRGLQRQALQVGTVTRLPELWSQVGEMVQTDLRLPELVSLAPIALDVSQEHITNLVLDWRYVKNITTPEGWQVLEPQWDAMRSAVRSALYDVKARSQVGQVEISNHSGKTGLGERAATVLNRQGIAQTVTKDEPSAEARKVSVVQAQPGQRTAALLVARLLGLADGQVDERTNDGGPALRVILGSDAARRLGE